MNKRIIKLMGMVLTAALILLSFSMVSYATPKVQEGINLQTAELHGEYDLSSTQDTTVIVEMEEPSIVQAKHMGKGETKEKLADERAKVINAVNKKLMNAKVNREYDYLFSGFSLELPANEILELLTVPGVKAVYPNLHYTTTQVGDAVIVNEESYSPMMMNSAPYIGAGEAWDAGFTGEGVTVAVIDTGVDYTHPDLAHAFGDYKGWDFVEDDNDPMEGDGQYHGTHVCGIVAANGLIKGIAPDAHLLVYRVLGPEGGSTEDVVAGIEKAVQDGADVMNLSLGNSLNNPDWPTSIALDWAMAEGVVAVTSNGNEGPDNWTVGSPGTSREAISVGATRLPYNEYSVSIFTSEAYEYPSAKVMGFPSDEELLALNEGEYEFVYVGLGAASDFEGKDVQGKIALISRGLYPFVDKAANAKSAGAVGAIIFNNIPGGGDHVDVPGMAVPTIKTTYEDGQKLLAELEAGNNTVSFDIEYVKTIDETIADFSSRGPVTFTWMIKPDVSAPGVNITSTFPGGEYAALEGTSMSSPHVAGAAALLLQKNPDWGTDNVKAALMNSAVDVIDPATGEAYPHNTQGAGSIRVGEALGIQTLIVPGSHSFGKFVRDSGRQIERQSFEIKNLSEDKMTYSYDVEFAGDPAEIKVMTSGNLKVGPGKSQQVNFNVQVDTSELAPGYYEGVIKVNDGVQTFDVPSILFIGEPDYPRVTGAFMEKESDGVYYVGSYLPGGAEVVAYDIYGFNAAEGTIGDFVDTIGVFENAPAPYHEFIWDGTVSDGTELANGYWVLAVYVEQAGVAEYRAYLVIKE